MKRSYSAPEIVELGKAAKITLGRPNLPDDDNCECTQKKCGCEIVAG